MFTFKLHRTHELISPMLIFFVSSLDIYRRENVSVSFLLSAFTAISFTLNLDRSCFGRVLAGELGSN